MLAYELFRPTVIVGQGRTGHSCNAMLVAVLQSPMSKKGPFEGILDFFCMECRRGLSIPVRPVVRII
jgi:hypothetical protein